MSKALDKLDASVTEAVKNGTASKNMTKEQFIDYATAISAAINTHLQFFTDLGTVTAKLQSDLIAGVKANSKNLTVTVWNKLNAGLTGVAKHRQESNYLGALIETMQASSSIIGEIVANVDMLFGDDKSFNLYNTKISHVAVYGIVDSARILAKFAEAYITAIIADKKSDTFKVPAYQSKYLEAHVSEVADICCRMINGRMRKIFTTGVINYRKSGSDVALVSAENASNSKFAKIGGQVTESDISTGCRGLRIFRIIGDFITDWFDDEARANRALRDQHKARVECHRMELEGEDPNSERYKRIVKIIKNYNDMIDRLNQKIDKYYNED